MSINKIEVYANGLNVKKVQSRLHFPSKCTFGPCIFHSPAITSSYIPIALLWVQKSAYHPFWKTKYNLCHLILDSKLSECAKNIVFVKFL